MRTLVRLRVEVLLAGVGAAMAAAPYRPQQDWTSWPGFGSARMWGAVVDSPHLATEIIIQFLSEMGLWAASEPTSASVTSHAMAAMYGERCVYLSKEDVKSHYNEVKARAPRTF